MWRRRPVTCIPFEPSRRRRRNDLVNSWLTARKGVWRPGRHQLPQSVRGMGCSLYAGGHSLPFPGRAGPCWRAAIASPNADLAHGSQAADQADALAVAIRQPKRRQICSSWSRLKNRRTGWRVRRSMETHGRGSFGSWTISTVRMSFDGTYDMGGYISDAIADPPGAGRIMVNRTPTRTRRNRR